MVVFQRVLYDDCQSGCQGIEPFAAGISLSDSQLPEIYSRSDASGDLANCSMRRPQALLMPSVRVWGRLLWSRFRGPIPSPAAIGDRVFWWCGRSSPD